MFNVGLIVIVKKKINSLKFFYKKWIIIYLYVKVKSNELDFYILIDIFEK